MYPKICTSRHDHHSQVVVANAEQEAELPEEFRAAVVVGGTTMSAEDASTIAMLSPEYSALQADRENLERDRLDLAEAQAQLAKDRHELTNGYKDAMGKLEADRAKHDEDVRLFEVTKAGEQPAAADKIADAPTDTSTSTPAKRVRTAKD